MKFIKSKNNSEYKNLKKLISSSTAKKSSEFLVKGLKEIDLCIEHGFKPTKIYICSEIFDFEKRKIHIKAELIDLSFTLFKNIFKNKHDGIIGLFKKKDFKLDNLNLPKNAFIVVLESPEKPGNIGAVFRTADAAGVDAIIISNPKTEIYNPNLLRNSLGSFFSMQIGIAGNEEVLSFLQKKNIKIMSSLVKGDLNYHLADYSGSIAIVIGPEESSLSNDWIAESTEKIKIPMKGKMNSLNLSVSAAIVIFEASKQRKI